MQHETEYYRSILDNLTGGFLSVDMEGRMAYANAMAARILKMPFMDKIMNQAYVEALSAYPELCRVVSEALHKQLTVHRGEFTIQHGDTPMIIGYSTLQVKNRAGAQLGVGIIFQDLTAVLQKRK